MCPGAGRSTSCARHALLFAVVPEPMVTVATEEARFDHHPLLFPPPKRQKGNATAPAAPPPWDGLTWSVGTPGRVVGKYPTPSPVAYSPSCTHSRTFTSCLAGVCVAGARGGEGTDKGGMGEAGGEQRAKSQGQEGDFFPNFSAEIGKEGSEFVPVCAWCKSAHWRCWESRALFPISQVCVTHRKIPGTGR